MCGRFVGAFSVDELIDEIAEEASNRSLDLDIEADMNGIGANYNTAPTHMVPVLRMEDPSHVTVTTMRWGLVPAWSKDPSVGSKMINARSETITEKPSFRGLVPKNRCVVPMSGFYEWDREDPKAKVPYFVPRADGHLMLVAGIWTVSPILGGLSTFAIITRDSLRDLSAIHDRSPVQLDAGDALDWMAESTPPLQLLSLSNPPTMSPRRVSTKVNSVRNNGPSLLDEEEQGSSEPTTLF